MIDPLQSAVDALRETTDGDPAAIGRYTRARVLAAVRQQKRRRVLNVAFGIPLAAILIGTGAWAASGERLPKLVHRVSVALGLRSTPALPTTLVLPSRRGAIPTEPVNGGTASLGNDDATPLPTSGPAASEPGNQLDVVAAHPTTPAPSASALSKPVPRDSQLTERELQLYERAHRAHFTEKDASAALGAWNEYLRAMPRGRFAVEASYNRALCLVRLGRNQEAATALRPFALGAFGSYRKADAAALLEQLSAPAP